MSIKYASISQGTSLEPGLIQVATVAEALAGTNEFKAITPALLEQRLAQLVGEAPEALDTLKELADAINSDENFFQTQAAAIADLQTQINTLAGGDLSGLQDEIDDTQVGAGLGTDGSYTAPSGSNYLGSATSLKDADSKLDAQIKTNADAIASMGSGNIAALQAEVDSIESSVGIGTDGSFTAQSGNYIGSATSVRGEISALDTQIKANADDIANLASSSAITALQSELDASQSGVGLASDGSHVARSGSNYIDSAASVVGEITLLDAQIKTNADAIALKADASSLSVYATESDLTLAEADIATNTSNIATNASDISSLETLADTHETSIGLSADGSFAANTGGNYISGASSVRGEINALDTQLKSTQDDLDTLEATVSGLGGNNQAEVDAIEASVGIGTDGSYTAPSGTNYIDSATSVRDEIVKLDTQVKNRADSIATNASNISTNTSNIALKADSSTVSAISTELTATQAAAGFNTDGTYSAHSGSNYIDSATSTKGALGLLDAQAKTNADDITNLEATVATITSSGDSNSDAIDALQLELDTTQTGAGLSGTGAYTAPGASNYLGSATSLKDADNKLDAQIKINADAIALKASSSDLSSAVADIATNTSDIATNASNISTNAGNISTNTSNISTNTSNIALKADSSTVSAISTELTATQSSVGLNTDGTYSAHSGSNYIDGASSVKGALTLLDTQIKDNADDISTNSGSISTNASDIAALETLADTHETALGLAVDGTYQSRSGSNYLDSATSLRGEITLLDAQAKTNADAISTEVTNRQSAVAGVSSTVSTLQSEVDATQSGAGLGTDGSYTANSGMNYIASASSLKDADEKLDAQIKLNADAIASNDSDISSINTSLASKASSASVSSLQTEVDGIETAVGLSSSGAYVPHSGSNYLDGASTVKGALTLLDTQAKSNADNISSNDTDISNLQALADTHESSIGLNTDGSYTALTGNYNTASTLKGAIAGVDTQVKTNADAIALRATSSELATLQSEVDSIESAVGLATDGTFVSFTGQNYLNSASSLKGGMELLDAAIKARQDNIDSEASTRASQDNVLSGKIDTVEASVGLQADGSLSITGTNYLNSSTSIVYALDVLDTNQKFLSDVQANIRNSAGLSSTGTLTAYSSTNYISGSLKAAIEALDTQVKSNADDISGLGGSDLANLQSELDDTQSGVGLATDGSHVARSGTNYLDSATSIVGEISALDTQVKSNADAVALKAAQTDMDAVETRLDSIETRGGGIFWDDNSADAVEMDGSLLMFKAHLGPWEINFNDLVTTNVTDLVFYGEKAPVNGDKNFAVLGDGNVEFTGKYAGYPIP